MFHRQYPQMHSELFVCHVVISELATQWLSSIGYIMYLIQQTVAHLLLLQWNLSITTTDWDTYLPSGAHLCGQGPPRWAPEGRNCYQESIGTFSLHQNTLLNKSQEINFIIEVVVTDRFHCITHKLGISFYKIFWLHYIWEGRKRQLVWCGVLSDFYRTTPSRKFFQV